ncbi:mucin-5AC-like isoform X2 [Frankliniella occidentalis]|uniref:Mucin-5AC-like isoform X2 n=1 Tax=Frankliniella occidentalis TaxID=133901 RepID=A0A6J1T8E3_FRAOC|nr:mucin-5AC-like isoform X2 [Frankliniella occidentalis]
MALLGVLRVLVVIVGTAPALLPCEPGPSPTATTPGPQFASPLKTPTALPSPLRTSTTSSPGPVATSLPRSPLSSPSRTASTTSPRPASSSTPKPTRPRTPAPSRPPTTSTQRPAPASSPRTPTSGRPPASAFRLAASPSTPLPSTPSPEQLVARIRALVRALRDADQLLRALQMFREQQQLGDDAVLRVMKEDANRTLVEQVEHAMRAANAPAVASMADIMGTLSMPKTITPPSTPSSNKTLSAKIPYTAYGKKSAKFVHGQQQAASAAGKPVAAVGKPRSGVAAAASAARGALTKKHSSAVPTTKKQSTPASSTVNVHATTRAPAFSAKTTYVSSKNGTVITRIKNDPILGEYKVVIRDLTPAASSGLSPRNASSGAGGSGDIQAGAPASSRRSDNASLPAPPKVLVPPVTSTPSTSERGRHRFQDATTPSSTAVPAAPTTNTTKSPPPPPASRRSGKSAPPKASGARAKPRNATHKGKPLVAATTAPRPLQTGVPSMTSAKTAPTSTTSNPSAAATQKSFQKKATDRQQIVLSATLRTAPPKEREEEVARERAPQDTPLLSGIFPRYGPGADLPHVERPFVPRSGSATPPASVLLPPLPDVPTTVASTASSSQTTQPFPPFAPTQPSSTSTPPPPSTQPPSSPPLPLQAPSSSPLPARDDERSAAGGGGPPQTVRLEPALSPSPPDAPVSYFLGESPWIPIFVNPQSARSNEIQKQSGGGAPSTTPAPPRTIVELTKLHVVEATPSPIGAAATRGGPQGRAVLNDPLEWRPSRTWQYAMHQDRVDGGDLQDLNQDGVTQQHLRQLQHLQLQLQPDLRLGGLSLVPVPLSVAESVYYRLTHVQGPGRVPTDLQGLLRVSR